MLSAAQTAHWLAVPLRAWRGHTVLEQQLRVAHIHSGSCKSGCIGQDLVQQTAAVCCLTDAVLMLRVPQLHFNALCWVHMQQHGSALCTLLQHST
jgi:hypothetical protein